MNTQQIRDTRMTGLAYALLALAFSFLWTLGIRSNTLHVLGIIIPSVAIYIPFEIIARKSTPENHIRVIVTRTISIVIVALFVACLYTSFKMFHVFGESQLQNIQTYEAITYGLFYTGLLVTWALSALQKDIFWLFKRKSVLLDERQLKERQEIFELSYKIGAVITIALGCAATITATNVTNSLVGSSADQFVGSFFGLLVCLILLLCSLPVIIASWKIKH